MFLSFYQTIKYEEAYVRMKYMHVFVDEAFFKQLGTNLKAVLQQKLRVRTSMELVQNREYYEKFDLGKRLHLVSDSFDVAVRDSVANIAFPQPGQYISQL